MSVPISGDISGRKFSYEVLIPKKEQFRIGRIFKQAEYSLAKHRSSSGSRLILDIGANHGLFALYMKAIYPAAVIHCYEPVASNLALLWKNVGHLPAIEIHLYALGARTGEVPIHLHGCNTGQHSLKKIEDERQYSGEAVIRCRAAGEELDELGLDRLDVLKIDTEGCEIDILDSLGKRVEAADHVLLEYHSECDRRGIDRRLSNFVLYSAHTLRIGLGTLKYVHRRLLPRSQSQTTSDRL